MSGAGLAAHLAADGRMRGLFVFRPGAWGLGLFCAELTDSGLHLLFHLGGLLAEGGGAVLEPCFGEVVGGFVEVGDALAALTDDLFGVARRRRRGGDGHSADEGCEHHKGSCFHGLSGCGLLRKNRESAALGG
jgi:hypothetical protein